MRGQIDVVRRAKLPASDVEREKQIAAADEWARTSRYSQVRKCALEVMERIVRTRSPGARAAIDDARSARRIDG